MSIASHQFGTKAQSNGELAEAVLTADISVLVNTFKNWRSGDTPFDIQPAVRDIIAPAAFDPRQTNIIMAAAGLAAEPNANPFHGNRHFLEVFTTSAMLGYDAVRDGRLSQENFMRLLTAALIHDYKHDGTTNNGEQFRLEKIAVNSAGDRLAAAGATAEDLSVIRDFVLTTDVSRDFSNPEAISPADSVKIYSYNKNPADLHEELLGLHHRQLDDAALMLQDSDVGSSLLDPELCRQSGEYLAQEQRRAFDPKGQVFFLDKICHRHMFSHAGHKLVQKPMDRIIREMDMADNPGHSQVPSPA